MNEKLQTAVAEMIEKSIKVFEAGGDFLAAEIPDVIHQLLVWNMVESATMTVAACFLMTFLGFIDYKLYRNIKKDWETEDIVTYYLLIGSIIRAVIWAFLVAMINLTWLKIWIAPKIFLIEYAAKLIK